MSVFVSHFSDVVIQRRLRVTWVRIRMAYEERELIGLATGLSLVPEVKATFRLVLDASVAGVVTGWLDGCC